MCGGICVLLTERGFWCCEAVLIDRIFISTSFGVAGMLSIMVVLVLSSSPAVGLVAWRIRVFELHGWVLEYTRVLLTERGFWCCEAVIVDRICISTSFGVAGMLLIMVAMCYVRCACVVFLASGWSIIVE